MLTLRQVKNQVTKKQRELKILLMEPATIPRKLMVNLTDDWQDKGWQSNWIINHKYKFIYCPILKVATTSMATTMLLLSDCRYKEEIIEAGDKTIRSYVFSHLKLSNYRYQEARQFIDDPSYFKFTIVRNPWSRLVSAYLDKFVIHKKTAISSTKLIEDAVYEKAGIPVDRQKSVNFRQFVEYIMAKDENKLNAHWKPQNLFFEGVNFDFIGKLESLREDFAIVKDKLNLDIELPYSSARKANYSQTEIDRTCYAEYYPQELQQLAKLPKYKQFYNPELIALTSEKYRQDIEQFGYEF